MMRVMRSPGIISLLLLLPCALAAQPDRITAPIDGGRTVVLRGNVHPNAQPRFDQGAVEPGFRVGYITLMLKKTDAQQAALEQLLQEQQDPASPNYRDWLTPEQYADRFGVSQHDLDKISAWLHAEGFTVEYTARGRNWLAFSGTAGQVRATFHTEIHRYPVDGEMHSAAAAEPSVPASLEAIVAGFMGLDDFYPKAPRHPAPDYTSATGTHSLAPGDLATIYNIGKLGIGGTGQSIVVVGQSAIDTTDIQAFRSNYNLPTLNLTPVLYGTDPKTISADMQEADLDLEWAGAVARNATLIYVYGSNVDSAVFYAIDQDYAPVISESYGGCEAQVPSQLPSLYRSRAQQANAEGITWLAASGDSGAAACDNGPKITSATQGLAVNFPASIPEVTAVGGTEFNDTIGTFWNSSNSANGGSAKSYIPEMAWNDTTAYVAAGQGLAATGGGVSSLYSKPGWQAGSGVPNGGFRDVPDLSLDASNEHDPYNAYSKGSWGLYGGTSISTPVFAGVVALLNQYLAAKGLGNINQVLYRLAQSAPSAFHDITAGNNNVPCKQGTPNCTTGTMGYSAGKGYDLATGLGSVDVYILATKWNSIPPTATTTTVTASPAIVTTGGSITLTATVKASSGGLTPTGSVSFTLGGISLGAANLVGSGSTATAPLTIAASQLNAGSNTITASYGGSTGFGVSSGSVTVNLTATLPAVNLAAITNAASYATGSVSPGENIVLWGTGIGPAQLTYGSLTASGALDTNAGNTRVLFDGVPAPVVYASDQQTSVMVPYEIAGQAFTYAVVEYQGVQSAPLLYNVSAAVPGIYTQNLQGFGPGAILNQDGVTLNGPGAPAAKGSVVAIYMTGEGQTNPAGVTGAIVPVNVQAPWKQPQLTATATVGSLPAAVEYYGSAPGMVSGVMQVNVQIPAGAASGDLPIMVTLSDPVTGLSYNTQARVTVSVQ